MKNKFVKNIIKKFYETYKEDAHRVVKIFGIKLRFKTPTLNPLEDICNIPHLHELLENGTIFPHPIGIVIHRRAIIGKNCTIYQNVTIGDGKYNNERQRYSPIIGDNVRIYANAVVVGGITVGNNSIIGAGAIVINDVPENVVVAGNPARIIKKLQ